MEPEREEDNDETPSPEIPVLDRKQIRVFGHLLTTSQQMWMGFLVPASISTIIFITNFALDVAVACQLFRDGHSALAGVTIGLVYATSIVCLVLTFMNNPQLESKCDLIKWIIIQLIQCLLFPVGIIHRFATRLFWSVVAITEEDPEREKALRIAAAGHQTELFFFLDSFINAAPQAVFQAYILLSTQIPTTNQTAWTQAASIVASVIALSKTAALYQRFESQRAVGRPVPWMVQSNSAHTKSLITITKFDPYLLMSLQNSGKHKLPESVTPSFIITPTIEENQNMEREQEEENTSSTPVAEQNLILPIVHIEEEVEQLKESNPQTCEPPNVELKIHENYDKEKGKVCATSEATTTARDEINSDQEVGKEGKEAEVITDINDMGNSSTQDELMEESKEQDPFLPVPQGNTPQSSSHYLESITITKVSVEDRFFWPRLNTPPSTPTADPHMRPRLSINTIKNQKRPSFNTYVPLPVRKPRKSGLQEDEPLGIFTAFNAWATYLLGRVLVIAAFTHFYLYPSLGLILIHYAVMVAYLSFCSPCPNFWAPVLGLIYILCPLEVKVRYRYPRAFLIIFFALVLLEDLSTVVLWYCGAEWESSWYDFAFFFIIGCHGLATLNVALYMFMFKPKTKYEDQISS